MNRKELSKLTSQFLKENKYKETNPNGYKINRKALTSSKHWLSLKYEFWDFYPDACLKCRSVENRQIDHIKPVTMYPWLVLDINNLQPLCKKCNREKLNYNCNDYRDTEDLLDIKELYKDKPYLHGIRRQWRKYLL